MSTTETIIFIAGVVGIALVLTALFIIVQAIACDNCPYQNLCKNNSDNKDFMPPCHQNTDSNNNNFNAI